MDGQTELLVSATQKKEELRPLRPRVGIRIAEVIGSMWVRLTRKLAQVLDDIDLRDHEIGDVFQVSSMDGQLLVAEGWASVHTADVTTGAFRRRTHHVSSARHQRATFAADRQRFADNHDRIRLTRERLERQGACKHTARRAEDRVREELRDARAKIITKASGG